MTPEAYEGGPIALVQNGDIITIDTQNRTLDLVSHHTHIHTHTHTHTYTISGCTLLPNMVTICYVIKNGSYKLLHHLIVRLVSFPDPPPKRVEGGSG